MIFDFESTTVKHFKTFHASQVWCCDCEQEFVSEHALDQHLNDEVHQRIPCQICRQDGSKPALDRHIVAEHYASVNPKRVFYRKDAHGCYICRRQVVKEIDSEQRLTSLKLHPLSDLGCDASGMCKRRFVSPSALLHHLESGSCCSGMTRRIVNDPVQANDPERIISSDPAAKNLLQYHRNPSEYFSSSGTPVFTPTSSASSSPVAATMTNNIGEQAVPFWSLDAEIPPFDTIPGAPTPLIPGFLTPTSTQTSFHVDHLNCNLPFPQPNLRSHDSALVLFHCPGALLASSTPHGVAPRHFSIPSGLAQHIESGACGGGSATLRKAMAFVQERLDQWGLGNIRLLK
ncbi:MAG: hypothetical protein ASARMPREDX12_003190 [Alectoria sarmentosa]|nr:MAG: hypothetical protein ASARMPREDX12_003190 [Alectoria sarmentosa]